MTADEGRGRRWTVHAAAIRPALLHGCALAVASLVSYLLTTDVLASIHSVSAEDAKLGGMWSVLATLFVYRFGYQESVTAAASRTAATLLSFVLCLAYLLIFPFSPLGLAVLIGAAVGLARGTVRRIGRLAIVPGYSPNVKES